MILWEIAGVGLVSPLDLAFIRIELTHDDLQERGLANAVRPHDREPFATLHQEIHTMEHVVVSEGLFHPFDLEDVPSAVSNLLESESRITARAWGELDQPLRFLLDHAHPALRLARLARLGAEAIHKFLVVRDLAFPGGDSLLPALPLGLLGLKKSRVVPVVEKHGLVVDIEDVRGDIVEKAVVVGDDDHGPGKVAQEHLQPPDGEDVEVVRRLVEEQDIRGARQYLSE